MKLVLASGSPRRRELLETLGFELEVRPPDIHETRQPGESVEDYVERLAREKSRAVEVDRMVVAADTAVELDGDILDKPGSAELARKHLQRLSGRTHRVLTGYAVRRGETLRSGVVSSEVCFRELTPQAIEAYLETGEPLDKAGGYGLQGRGAALVREVRGSASNVVGLPLDEVLGAIQRLLRGTSI